MFSIFGRPYFNFGTMIFVYNEQNKNKLSNKQDVKPMAMKEKNGFC